jgi:hypothetical protein
VFRRVLVEQRGHLRMPLGQDLRHAGARAGAACGSGTPRRTGSGPSAPDAHARTG